MFNFIEKKVEYVSVLKNAFDDWMIIHGRSFGLENEVKVQIRAICQVEFGLL